LDKLKEQFPGIKMSEVRFYPDDESEFKNLMRKYTFGEERDKTTIDTNYKNLKNKPYIVISFNDDLEGSITSTKTQSKLIPLQLESRDYKTTKSEILELRDKILDEIKNTKKVSLQLNANADILMSQSQILDILID
jgi:hypothetical protein